MIWYPYAQMKTMPAARVIDSAQGVYLHSGGKKYIDSISSWWTMIHGYAHPEIVRAIQEQAARLPHVMLGGLTHEPALELAAKLAAMLPGDLKYCFFSDSGSVGVEVALKMAMQRCANLGCRRPLMLALQHAYHGDTFKAMEAGDDDDYHFAFADAPKSVIHIPTELGALEDVFARQGEQFSCFILEPLLQGAGGMRMYEPEFLRRARELCDQYDVTLIFDEVATGFGRTGHRFAADLVVPDILVLGKALTGGHIGHAVTVAGDKVWGAFYSDDPRCALMHGPTYMANPLACAAALASIRVFERDKYMDKIARIAAIIRREMEEFADPRIREVRMMGGCVCIETHSATDVAGFADWAWEHGVFARPFLKYIYAMVPYIIQEQELVHILDVMKGWFRK